MLLEPKWIGYAFYTMGCLSPNFSAGITISINDKKGREKLMITFLESRMT